MNDDIPWAYVAMIFIAFASWVYGRIKEAAEIRRARAAAKRAAQESRKSAQPAPAPSPYRPTVPTPTAPSLPAPVSPPAPAAATEAPKTFRELFEMLQEQSAPAPVATEKARPSPPPPLPATAITEEPVQSEVDRIFYGPAKTKKPAPAPPLGVPLRVERVRGKTSSNLNHILKNRSTLREALILKEILDTPVAMKE